MDDPSVGPPAAACSRAVVQLDPGDRALGARGPAGCASRAWSKRFAFWSRRCATAAFSVAPPRGELWGRHAVDHAPRGPPPAACPTSGSGDAPTPEPRACRAGCRGSADRLDGVVRVVLLGLRTRLAGGADIGPAGRVGTRSSSRQRGRRSGELLLRPHRHDTGGRHARVLGRRRRPTHGRRQRRRGRTLPSPATAADGLAGCAPVAGRRCVAAGGVDRGRSSRALRDAGSGRTPCTRASWCR